MPHQPEYRFADFLKPENIRCRLEVKTWQEAVHELADLLHRNEDCFDKDAVVAACIEREEATSTVIAPHLALPHARVEDLDQLLVAIGTSGRGIAFASEERGLVHVVILILTPKSQPGLYLQALAALSRELGALDAVDRVAACRSAEEVYDFFAEKRVPLPPFLKARNLMEPRPVTLLESDDLKKTIDLFCSRQVLDIPVVDEQGDLRGTVALEDLLHLSLPEHLLWMHDLSPILHFEPFADLLRHDRDSKVADFMREDHVAVRPDMPAIQLAKMFLTQQVRQILVVDGRKLLGVVDLHAFMAKIFWA